VLSHNIISSVNCVLIFSYRNVTTNAFSQLVAAMFGRRADILGNHTTYLSGFIQVYWYDWLVPVPTVVVIRSNGKVLTSY